MWRDRTNLYAFYLRLYRKKPNKYRYISYRQSFAHHPTKKPRYFGPSSAFSDNNASSFSDNNASSLSEERRGLIAGDSFEDDGGGDAVIEMDLLPPRWMDIQDEVNESLAEIAQKAVQLDQLHQKHVLPGFGDDSVRRRDEDTIEQLTQEITRGFHACQRAIKRIDGMVKEQQQQHVSQGDETLAKNLQISLASRVQESSARFRKKQSTYLKSTFFSFLSFFSVSSANLSRTARTRRHGTPIRTHRNPSPKPIRRPFADGIRRRQILLANHAAANLTETHRHKQRRGHRAARTRNQRYCQGDYRAVGYFP